MMLVKTESSRGNTVLCPNTTQQIESTRRQFSVSRGSLYFRLGTSNNRNQLEYSEKHINPPPTLLLGIVGSTTTKDFKGFDSTVPVAILSDRSAISDYVL